MNVLLASGIWPPEVGGPATHGPEFGRYLVGNGHHVRAVTTSTKDGPADSGFPVIAARKDRAHLIRHPAAAWTVFAAAADTDVLYATGMYGRSALTATLRRIPLVLKIVSDPAYERSRRLGWFSGTLEAFQQPLDHVGIRALKRLRDLTVSRAAQVVIPSHYLAEIATAWGLDSERVCVIPNPAPEPEGQSPRAALRERYGMRFPTFVFAGRLVPQKNVPLALAALEQVPEASLVLIGDGSERSALEDTIRSRGMTARVNLVGGLARSEAIEWMRAADVAVIPSSWENFPHAAVEALSVGTPVLATAVGGVPEIIQSGVNGILVAPGDADALAAAMRSLIADRSGLATLREGALASSGRYQQETVYGSIEAELERAAASAPRLSFKPR